MKRLTVIVFENQNTYRFLSNGVCERFSNIDESREFCGLWGEIESNKDQVINSISATVNHFIGANKKEIIFGCCEKDYSAIMEKIDLSNCTVNKTDAESVLA